MSQKPSQRLASAARRVRNLEDGERSHRSWPMLFFGLALVCAVIAIMCALMRPGAGQQATAQDHPAPVSAPASPGHSAPNQKAGRQPFGAPKHRGGAHKTRPYKTEPHKAEAASYAAYAKAVTGTPYAAKLRGVERERTLVRKSLATLDQIQQRMTGESGQPSGELTKLAAQLRARDKQLAKQQAGLAASATAWRAARTAKAKADRSDESAQPPITLAADDTPSEPTGTSDEPTADLASDSDPATDPAGQAPPDSAYPDQPVDTPVCGDAPTSVACDGGGDAGSGDSGTAAPGSDLCLVKPDNSNADLESAVRRCVPCPTDMSQQSDTGTDLLGRTCLALDAQNLTGQNQAAQDPTDSAAADPAAQDPAAQDPTGQDTTVSAASDPTATGTAAEADPGADAGAAADDAGASGRTTQPVFLCPSADGMTYRPCAPCPNFAPQGQHIVPLCVLTGTPTQSAATADQVPTATTPDTGSNPAGTLAAGTANRPPSTSPAAG